ncbi:hypothetical protein G9A89_019082 [Geosiphon pyriformis]|nr:hypothetical protein G9A89_019082 [Geosiphon pyriformis]
MPEELNFQQTTLSKSEVATPRSNSSKNTILSVQIAQNANFSDIFPFEFKANKSPFLLSNAAVNKQKAITAMYIEAEVKEKPHLVNFRQVPAMCSIFNKKSGKISVFEFEEKKELPITETFMVFGSTSSWAEKTEQEIFEETKGWNVVRYFTSEPQKQPPYILLKCKDCNKKLLSMGACISLEEKYETCICYFCKACHRNDLNIPKEMENGTTLLVSYVEICY